MATTAEGSTPPPGRKTRGMMVAFGLVLVSLSLPTRGGISLSQTRVIISAADKAQSLTVKNRGDDTYLIQSRIQRTPDDTTAAPFVVTPPLLIMKPDSRQLLRIVPQNLNLPTDRESVFYLSVLAIPAQKEKVTAPMQLSMGLRFMIKLFYRPNGITAPNTAQQCNLRFNRNAQGVTVENPAPYFQTLGSLTFNHVPKVLEATAAMLPPLSSHTYPLSSIPTEVEWQVITDYGGLSQPPCRQTLSAVSPEAQ